MYDEIPDVAEKSRNRYASEMPANQAQIEDVRKAEPHRVACSEYEPPPPRRAHTAERDEPHGEQRGDYEKAVADIDGTVLPRELGVLYPKRDERENCAHDERKQFDERLG